MARPKKIGNEKCPYPECGKLGRKRLKSIRNRPTGRYIRYYWFRHNDSNIPEHYIDNLIRPKEVQKNIMYEIGEEHNKIGHRVRKWSKRIMSFDLTKEDRIKFSRDLDWFYDNVTVPLGVLGLIYTGQIKVQHPFLRDLRMIARENIFSSKNVFGFGYRYWYEKYDRRVRLERNKRRNAKLSAGNGSTSNEFTGIESESINPKLK